MRNQATATKAVKTAKYSHRTPFRVCADIDFWSKKTECDEQHNQLDSDDNNNLVEKEVMKPPP